MPHKVINMNKHLTFSRNPVWDFRVLALGWDKIIITRTGLGETAIEISDVFDIKFEIDTVGPCTTTNR